MNGLWRFPLHDPSQGNQQYNIMEQSTRKHWFQYIKPMVLHHPREYFPTSQQDLAIFYDRILCCPTKRTLLQEINDGSFVTFPGLTEKLISDYLPES